MTSRATDVLVQPLQRKGSAFVMIEERRLPLGAVVTFDAGSYATLVELLSVNVLVAVFTLGGCGRKIGRNKLGLHIRRFVAVDAGGRLVRSRQWKRRFRVVEA